MVRPPLRRRRKDDVRPDTHVPWPGVASCLALTAGIMVADVAAGPEKTQYVGLLVAVPFLAATFTGVMGVLVLGHIAWLAGLLIGLSSDDGSSAP